MGAPGTTDAEARGRSGPGALLLACVVLSVAGTPAQAEHHSYENRTFDRSPAEGLPGAVVQVWGTGCSEGGKPYQTAWVWLYNTTFDAPLQRYPIRADGTWGGGFTVPLEAPPGDYRLDADCAADDMVFRIGYQEFRVLDPSPPTSPPTTAAPPTTAPPTTAPPPPSRTPKTRRATTSSSAPPTTAAPAPTEPSSSVPPDPERSPSSVPAVAAPPERPSGAGGPAVPVVAAGLLAAGAAWWARRRRAANGP